MKKTLKLITLLLILILSLGAFTACADEGDVDDSGNVPTPPAPTYEYVLNDDEDGIILKKYVGDTTLTEITVPSSIDGLPVTEIGKNLFTAVANFKQKLVKVNLPDSVVKIGSGAFKNCKALVTVNTEKVKSFDISCFEYCVKLSSVSFASATSISKNAFNHCEALTEITIPSTVRTIQNDSFTFCTRLSTVNLGEGVKEIAEKAFAGCMSLTNIDLSNVERFNDGCFSDCVALEDVNLVNVVYLGMEAFQNCTSLKRVYIGPRCIIIYNLSFYKSYNLQYLEFAPTTIDDKWISVTYNQSDPSVVWSNCSNLSAFTNPQANAARYGDLNINGKKDDYTCKKAYMIQNPFGKYVQGAYSHANGTCSCGEKGRANYNFGVDNVVVNEGDRINVKVGQTVNLQIIASWGPNDPIEYKNITQIRSFSLGQNLVDENMGDSSKGFKLTFTGTGTVTLKMYSSLNSQERIISFVVTA